MLVLPRYASPRLRRWILLAVLVAWSVAFAAGGSAQIRGRRFGAPPRMATRESYDGAFVFCRVMFRNASYGDGGGWSVDYPRADVNLPYRLSELTKIPVSKDSAGQPNHVVVRLTDPELFRCPFVMMTEPGGAYLDADEARQLREYLLKGGFLWADDFWGEYAWSVWVNEIRKALPSGTYPIIDLLPDHPIFHTLYAVPRLPQIPSINFWFGNGGTSERSDSTVPHARAITDPNGHMIVLMTHNTDFGDAFERETDNREYFDRFAADGYAFGINVVLYAMTH